MKQVAISVVVPCFNEAPTIYENLKIIHGYLFRNFHDFEMIAVDDGSTDGTRQELARFQGDYALKIIRKDVNRGKGSAVKSGVAAGRHNVLMFLDADLGIPVEELGKFIEELEKGHDIVIASRFVPGLKIKRPVAWHRRLMEKGFRFFRLLIVSDWKVKDTQCGFKVFSREIAEKVFPRLTLERFAFDAELVFVASKFGYTIKELPVTLQNPPNSHVRMIRDPLNMFSDLIKIRVNDWRGKYK